MLIKSTLSGSKMAKDVLTALDSVEEIICGKWAESILWSGFCVDGDSAIRDRVCEI